MRSCLVGYSYRVYVRCELPESWGRNHMGNYYACYRCSSLYTRVLAFIKMGYFVTAKATLSGNGSNFRPGYRFQLVLPWLAFEQPPRIEIPNSSSNINIGLGRPGLS